MPNKPLSLADRLKKSLDAAAPIPPDLNPYKYKKEEVVLPDLREVVSAPADRMKILRLVNASLEFQKAETEAKKARKPITAQLKEIIESSCSATSFMADGVRVATFPTTRKTLSRERLLDAGVSMDVINRCTIETSSLTLKITGPDGEEEE